MTAYILPTVDSATALLYSPRTFPSGYVTAPLRSPYTCSFFFSRQIPVASHRHFPSLASRLGWDVSLYMSTSTIVKDLNKLKLNPLCPFLVLTNGFNLVPAEFLVIHTFHRTFIYIYICNILIFGFLSFLQLLPTTTNEDHKARDESRSPSVSFFLFRFFIVLICLVSFLQVLTRSARNQKAQEMRRTSLGPLHLLRLRTGPEALM